MHEITAEWSGNESESADKTSSIVRCQADCHGRSCSNADSTAQW